MKKQISNTQYVARVTTAYYIHSKTEKGLLEWAEEKEEFHVVAKADTLKECKEKAFAECEGSRWCLYPSLIIEEPGGGEVYSSIVTFDKCGHCGNENYDRVVMDLEKMLSRGKK
jgi:hypothetical protein